MAWMRKIGTAWTLGLAFNVGLTGCQSVSPAVRGDAGAFTSVADDRPVESRLTTAGRDYRIGVPDRVSVACDRVRGLSVRDAAVDAEGFVTLPTLGRVKVVGLTADEASEALTRRVRTVDSEATMRLEVTRFASRHVYAFGEIGRVGPVSWRPGIRLADVLTAAALRESADVGEISVIRPGVPGDGGDAPRRVTVDFARLLEAGDTTVNLALRAGDVVVVPGDGDRPAWASWWASDPAAISERPGMPFPAAASPSIATPVATAESIEPRANAPEVDWELGATDTWPVSNPSATGFSRSVQAGSNPTTVRTSNRIDAGYFGTVTRPAETRSGVVFWN
ncbi:MAG: polysaccharide biosynthesis/export family protein [Planctomycetota bacterium]